MLQSNNPYSDLKIFLHPDKLSDILNSKRTAPLYVRIKPTNVCNQNCYYCAYASDQTIKGRSVDRRESIPYEKLKEVISDLSDMGTKAITFSGGGEPLCYPDIIKAIELVRGKGIDYALITNAQALDEDKREALKEAKWIRISLDSASKELYKSIRGVDTFDKVINNIAEFAKIKNKECVLGINFVVTKENCDNILDICKIASSAGVDNIKFAPMVIKDKVPEYHGSISKKVEETIATAKEKYQNNNFSIIDKYSDDLSFDVGFKKKCKQCYIKEMFCVVGADCKVYYCHQKAYTEDGCIGSIENQSFKKLWFSEETTKKFLEFDAEKTCDFRCVFEERNELIDTLVRMDKRHVNFI